MRPLSPSFIIIVMIGLCSPVLVSAMVSPSQVAVLANEQSSESLDLATYYMERRGIPLANRIALDLPTTDSISREVYEQDLLKPVREELEQKGLTKRIKVLVTMYGMPLRVQAPKLTMQEEQWIDDARGWVESAMSLLRDEEKQILKQQASLTSVSQPPHDPMTVLAEAGGTITPTQIRQWRKQLSKALNDIRQEIEKQPNVKDKITQVSSLEKVIRRVFGKVGVQVGRKQTVRSLSGGQRKESMFQQMLASLMHDPSPKKRTRAYAVVQEAYGLWGILAFAQWEIGRYQQVDGSASLDSELSFLWWESGTYPLAGRLPNPFYIGHTGVLDDWPLPFLMVSRIDAPTVTHVQGMIDQAMETESRGLRGNVYVDARGKKKGPPLSYGFYDADLQNFANTFRTVSSYPMTLENTEQRLSQPGQAPDVALYVGWYRLRHYEDAFTFKSGAIGYHIASGEAVSIHNPKEPGWCKNALERGITVTLGPVGEPYLDAFPLPTEFFGLLYSGKYSLVEAYYLSIRYVSWKMVLFGDPLYRPWSQSVAEREQVAQMLLHKRPFPVAPAQHVFPAVDVSQDRSQFPGKYVVFDPQVLSP